MSRSKKNTKTKFNIISEMAGKTEVPLSVASLAFHTVFEEISRALLKEQRVELRGFGVFVVKKYKAYKGRNPQNQKKVMVRAKKRPRFKPGLSCRKWPETSTS